MSDFLKGKRVFVAGGTGFLGSNYIKGLVDRGAYVFTTLNTSKLQIPDEYINKVNVVTFNCDFEKLEDCVYAFEKSKAEYVIHCAGKICHPGNVSTDIQTSIQNIKVTGNLLEAAHKTGVKGFLDLNSSTGYPDRRYPIKEDEFWEDEPYKSYFGYGWMRRYREKLMEHVSRFSDMKIALCRGTAIFGPYDNFDLKTCHVVPALIKRITNGEDPLIIWGSPDVVRDFMFVEDVVEACLMVLEKGESMRPYNVGYGQTITIDNIVKTILEVTGRTPEMSYDSSKPTTIPFRMVSTERLTNEIGFVPKHTFKEGMEKTVKWYLENKKN